MKIERGHKAGREGESESVREWENGREGDPHSVRAWRDRGSRLHTEGDREAQRPNL